MIDVNLEDVYAEACRALGESVVRERIIAAELQRLAAENETLRAQLAAQGQNES